MNKEIARIVVIHILADKLGIEYLDIHKDSNLRNDLGADSLDEIELMMEFEKLIGQTYEDEQYENIRTVSDCIDFFYSKTSKTSKGK